MTSNNPNSQKGATMKQVELQDGASADVVQENVQHLKELFPDAFTENGVNFDTLRQLLGDLKVLDEGEEKYGLNWHGKKQARQIALTPSLGTLLPCPEESVDWDITQNLFIEGDNLEVLKLLQKSYANKVKMIYIDPPYNTGKEFVYPDKFQDNLDTYLKYTGQIDNEGLKFASNTETGGRKHTNWLNMMYPRLKLAKNLLSYDGVIFISIDDNEQTNLKTICDDIFGQENFISNLVWKKKTGAGAIDFVFDEHEYVLVYCKNKDQATKWRHLSDDHGNFNNPDQDERGPWESCALTAPSKNRNFNQLYMIEVFYNSKKLDNIPDQDKDGRTLDSAFQYGNNFVVLRNPLSPEEEHISEYNEELKQGRFIRRWAYTLGSIRNVFDQRRIYLKEGNVPRFKKFEYEYDGKALRSIYFDDFSTQQGTSALRDLLGESIVEYPKPPQLLKHLFAGAGTKEDIIMDFFAGSGTTADAVMQLNSEDDGQRRCISVQLPEITDEKSEAFKAGYKTIAEIAKERIRRAAKKIKDENPDYDGDLGFKVFKLASSNIKAWNPNRTDLEGSLLDHKEHLVEGRSEQDILYELLLKRGVDLTTPIETKQIAGKNVYSIGFGKIITCLDDLIAANDVEPLAAGIIAWQKELKNTLGVKVLETHVFFKDSAFRDDVAKTNMAAILSQNGIDHVRSL